MSNLRNKSVIIVSRLFFTYFEQGKKSLQCNFSDTAVSDMEIINKIDFDKLVTQFIVENKLTPTTSIIIVSQDLTFEKELSAKTNDKLFEETQQFLENVPFDDVTSNVVKTEKSHKIIAYNRDFLGTLKNIFEKQGFLIAAVVPEQIVLKNINIKSVADYVGLKMVIDHFDAAKHINEVNLETSQNVPDGIDEKEDGKEISEKKTIPRVYFMLAALGVLFLVLIVLLIGQFTPKKRPAPNVQKINTLKPTVSPTVMPSIDQATQSATLVESKLELQILNATTTPGLADSFRRTLNGLGFSNVTVGSTSSQSSNTLVVFSEKVTTETRQKITKLLEEKFGPVSQQENNTLKFDIMITLGKPQITP